MAKKQETKVETTKQEEQVTVIPDIDIQGANDALEEAMMDLIYDEPFYANLTLNMRRQFTTKYPTLAVNVTDEVNIWINPYFFMALSIPERIDCIKHECLHVINNHFVRFRDLEPQIYDEGLKRSHAERMQDMKDASELNKGADYAINEYLPKLPREVSMFDPNGKMMMNPDVLPDGSPNPDAGKPIKAKLLFVKDLKQKNPAVLERENLEYYYEILKQQQQKQNGGGANGKGKGQPQQGQGQPQQGQGNGQGDGMTLDDHSAWHESDATEDQITQKVKEVVNKAVEQTGDKGMGSVAGHIIQSIQKLNHTPKDWRQDVQRFAARTAEIIIENSRKKRNRRYGILYAGIKTYPKLNLTIALDTSGSVGDEELLQFHAEMIRLYNMGISLTVIECDTQVNNSYKFDPKKPFKVHGRGGTRFAPVFEYIQKEKLETDGLIYFTDGECWGEDIKKPNYPVLWALTPPFKLQGLNFGFKTKVEVKKKHAR